MFLIEVSSIGYQTGRKEDNDHFKKMPDEEDVVACFKAVLYIED
jgi:hypothetical protein